MELGLSQEAVSQLLEAKEKAEERAEKAIEDLCHECFFHAALTWVALGLHLTYSCIICRVLTSVSSKIPSARGAGKDSR